MAETQDIVPVAKVLPPIERSAEGLRDALFDELNLLRTGEATTAHARALANVARLIIETARLELQAIQEVRRSSDSLRLGSGEA
jgi:hypothetical protein